MSSARKASLNAALQKLGDEIEADNPCLPGGLPPRDAVRCLTKAGCACCQVEHRLAGNRAAYQLRVTRTVVQRALNYAAAQG